MTPVDSVAAVVVASSLYPGSSSTPGVNVAQLSGRPRMAMTDFLGALETYGYVVPEVSYEEWAEKMEDYVASSGDGREEHALLPLLHFVTSDLPGGTKARELRNENTQAALKADGGRDVILGVSEETLGLYLAYLVQLGFMPKPVQKGKKALPVIVIGEEQLKILRGLSGRGAVV